MEERGEIAVDDDMNSDSYSNKVAGENEGNADKGLEDKSEHTAENDSDCMDVYPAAVNSGDTLKPGQTFGEDYASTSKSRVVVRRRKNYENSRRSILPRKSKTKAIESINNLARGFQGVAKKTARRKRLGRGVAARSRKSNKTKARRSKPVTRKNPRTLARRPTRSTLVMKNSGLSLLSSGSSTYGTSITQSDVCSRCRYCIRN